MKDVQATLRRIDEEITGHNQQIARSRVEIARLQETRLVLMNLAEGDIVAAHAHRDERQGVINGSHSRPVLIVRKTGTGDEEGSASKAAKEGTLNKAGNKRGLRKKGATSELARFRERIVALLTDAPEPMESREIGDHLGVPRSEPLRKPMQNALYHMRISGRLHRDTDKRYSLTKLRPPQ